MMEDNMVYVLVFDSDYDKAQIMGVYRTEAGAKAAKMKEILDDDATIDDYLDYCRDCADDDKQPQKISDWVSDNDNDYYRIECVEMMN